MALYLQAPHPQCRVHRQWHPRRWHCRVLPPNHQQWHSWDGQQGAPQPDVGAWFPWCQFHAWASCKHLRWRRHVEQHEQPMQSFTFHSLQIRASFQAPKPHDASTSTSSQKIPKGNRWKKSRPPSSQKQEIKVPTTFEEMMQSLRFYGGVATILFGSSSALMLSVKNAIFFIKC